MERQQKIQKVVEAFLNKGYGETLAHYDIAYIAQTKDGTHEYWSLMQSVSKKLLECGKMIENVRGVGYRVVNPDEYSQQSAKCVMSGARKIGKGSRILQNAPVKDMTPLGVQAYNAISDRMAILSAAVTGAKVEINMLSSKRKNPLALMSERAERAG